MEILKNFTIVVPVFDEFENLSEFIEIVKKEETQELFYFIDNGSSDSRIENLLKKNNLNFSRTENNLGFGGGIKFGISKINSDFISWMPCNLKVSPSDAVGFINKIKEPNSTYLYKALRSERPKVDYLKTVLFSIIQSILLRTFINDSGGTPTAVHKSFFNKIDLFPDDYTFETYVLIKGKMLSKTVRIKVKYGLRKYGKSKWQNGLLTEINFIINLYKKSKKWVFDN